MGINMSTREDAARLIHTAVLVYKLLESQLEADQMNTSEEKEI